VRPAVLDSKPFDSHGVTRPIHKLSLSLKDSTIRRLAVNPLYWDNHVKYLSGGLYRAVLGLELLWDTDVEKRLNNALASTLEEAARLGQHIIFCVRPETSGFLKGVKWEGAIMPRAERFYRFTEGSAMDRISYGEGELLTCRLIDDGEWMGGIARVDIENEAGDVISMHRSRWERVYESSGTFKPVGKTRKSTKAVHNLLQGAPRRGRRNQAWRNALQKVQAQALRQHLVQVTVPVYGDV